MVWSGARGRLDGDEMSEYYDGASSEEDVAPLSNTNQRPPQGMEMTETKSGIEWKFANQGMFPPTAFHLQDPEY